MGISFACLIIYESSYHIFGRSGAHSDDDIQNDGDVERQHICTHSGADMVSLFSEHLVEEVGRPVENHMLIIEVLVAGYVPHDFNEFLHPVQIAQHALRHARDNGFDTVLLDTAGRLQNKANLMNELNKISRVIDRECPDSSRETLLVLDATTGQNGLIQAKQFQEISGCTGIVLTKLDGTAKGGIVIAIAQELQVPVKLVGLGEGIDDMRPFDAKEYVEALI